MPQKITVIRRLVMYNNWVCIVTVKITDKGQRYDAMSIIYMHIVYGSHVHSRSRSQIRVKDEMQWLYMHMVYGSRVDMYSLRCHFPYLIVAMREITLTRRDNHRYMYC